MFSWSKNKKKQKNYFEIPDTAHFLMSRNWMDAYFKNEINSLLPKLFSFLHTKKKKKPKPKALTTA